MTILITLTLVVVGLIGAAIGFLGMADPEGRGGKFAALFFGGLLMAAVGLGYGIVRGLYAWIGG